MKKVLRDLAEKEKVQKLAELYKQFKEKMLQNDIKAAEEIKRKYYNILNPSTLFRHVLDEHYEEMKKVLRDLAEKEKERKLAELYKQFKEKMLQNDVKAAEDIERKYYDEIKLDMELSTNWRDERYQSIRKMLREFKK
jgi:hypothetical protein